MQTSVSALRVNVTDPSHNYDVTLLSEAEEQGASVCMDQRSGRDTYHAAQVVLAKHPDLITVPCHTYYDTNEGDDVAYTCIDLLRAGNCTLWASDELLLQQYSKEEPGLSLTPERFQSQHVVWPIRRGLNVNTTYLLKRWVYAVLANQSNGRC